MVAVSTTISNCGANSFTLKTVTVNDLVEESGGVPTSVALIVRV